MKRSYPLILVALSVIGLQAEDQSATSSVDPHSFELHVANDATAKKWIADEVIVGSRCEITLSEVEGHPALKIATKDEFSNAFIDVKKLFGYPLDLTKSRYLSMKVLIPKESWISAIKLNVKDDEGNLGGVPEVTNNFYAQRGEWMEVVVDLQDLLPKFQMWYGEKNPLKNVAQFGLNPYNAHQASASVYYVNDIRIGETKLARDYTTALTPRIPAAEKNIPFKISFDDDAWLSQVNGYRAFDTTFQAFAKGIAGNESRAIRMKGKDKNKHLAFLPALDKITGAPVDFTKAKKLVFSYHLTEDSDDFDGSWLYFVTEHWKDIIICKEFYRDYKKGGWHRIEVDIASLEFERARGDDPVLPSVYELRLGLNYFPDKKNIEMWIDDFGWE